MLDLDNVPGWLLEADITALVKLASSLPSNSTIVEVGSLYGKSACHLARSAPTSTVYCFDLWAGHSNCASDGVFRINDLDTFKYYTKQYNNIIAKKLDNPPEDAQWGDQQVDMVFIDIEHINPSDWETIEYWMLRLKQGAILSGHDYFTVERNGFILFPDVNDNVARLEKLLGQPVTLFEGSSIWSFKI